MEVIVTTALLVAFGVYLTERLMVSKAAAEKLRVEVVEAQRKVLSEVEALTAKVDAQRDRLNKFELRR